MCTGLPSLSACHIRTCRYYALSVAQPVFTFTHPNWQQPADNNRSITLRFPRPVEDGVGVLHGFAGYFESVLYPGGFRG